MLPFLALHALAAQRGDGLHPKLLALLERHARSEAGLVAAIEPVEKEPLYPAEDGAPDDPRSRTPSVPDIRDHSS